MRRCYEGRAQRLGWRLGRYQLIVAGLLAFALLAAAGLLEAQEGATPNTPPDAAAGLPIHAERCANCHGATGQGDGELAANLPNPPAAHASTEYLRTAVPSDMFAVITSGRIPNGMPPFGPESSEPLSEVERWNVIAALFSLGTPLESVEQGQAVYEENCQACHGERGAGDGPQAAELTVPMSDLAALDAWSSTSSQALFDLLGDEESVAFHDFNLSVEDLWLVTDYVRTFGYLYTDALAAFRPLETATVSGHVLNGTSGEFVTETLTARLRAFTQDLEVALTLEEELDADGRFHFDLADVPQEWFYRVAVTYNGLDFGSDFGQLTFDSPALELPVTVYETTTDAEAVSIQQLHMVLGFAENQVRVSEIYVVGNSAPAVYVGTGDVDQGTFALDVPEGATDLAFQRGFGSIDSFIPANEVIRSSVGWADTLPLRPGPSSLTMLVEYTLPYDDEATISHSLFYPTAGVNLILPDAGVSLAGEDGWVSGGKQTLESDTFLTYSRVNLAAASELTLRLDGRPRLRGSAAAGLVRNNTSELAIGGGAAVVVVGAAILLVRRWRQEPAADLDRDDLLQAIADLDDEYQAGAIDEDNYRREREELKAELMAIWDEVGEG